MDKIIIQRTQAAKNQAKQKWNAEHYDQLKIYIRKGGREIIKQIAQNEGLSAAEYIKRLVIKDAKSKGINAEEKL